MSYDKETLILSHIDLAKNIANREWRTATHALKSDDMLSLAYLGLTDAADRWIPYCQKNEYDPSAVQYFKVFAALRIRGTIRDYIRKEDWATRTLRTKAKKLKDAGQDQGLSVEELAERTGMTVSEVNKVLAKLQTKPVSLEAKRSLYDYSPTSDAKDMQLKEDTDTESAAFANTMNDEFISTYKALSSEVQVVLALYYYSKLDLRTIAEKLQLTESRVSQLHSAGVMTIQQALTQLATEGVQ